MITRRKMVATSAAGVAALALPRMAFAAEQADVVIIGAGLSGLHSAELLSGLGMKVVVLEADAQVGGRVQTVQTANGPIDVGASQIGRSYARVLDAVRRHKLKLIPEDRDLLTFGAHFQDTWFDPADWENNPLNKTVGAERAINPILMGQAVTARHNPLKEIDDWLDPRFSGDDISLRQLMEREGYSPAAIELAKLSAPGIGIDETSMLRMWQESTRGGIDHRTENAPSEAKRDHPFGETNDRNLVDGLASISNIVGGCQQLPLAMAASLGDAVRLGRRVARIELQDTGGSVICTDGSTYKGRFVISALPFSVLRNVEIIASRDNPLQRKAITTMPYANTARMYLNIEKPFWKEDGLPASFSTDGPIGMFWGIDNHTGEGVHRAMIVMVGKVAQAISRLQHEEAEAFVRTELARLRPASRGLVRYQTYKDWARDPNHLGCGFSLAPGQVNEFGRTMTDPWQVLHFAGEHTRRVDFGMESAMESGERVAFEISERA